MRRLDLVAAVAIGAMGTLAPVAARAHFVLMAPANWANQAAGTGAPLKSAPCGQADPGVTAVPTNMVTAFAAGQTVTVTIDERMISHPGHYRVALSTTGMSGLPADPAVTAGGQPSTACGSTVIQNPPVFPVIADGMLVHTAAPTMIQSFTVKLPDNMTCSSNCVLQVIEFMSNHALNNPGGCFYHHCANITIQVGGGTDAGTGESGTDSGCGCSAGRGPASALGLFAMLALVAARRRRTP